MVVKFFCLQVTLFNILYRLFERFNTRGSYASRNLAELFIVPKRHHRSNRHSKMVGFVRTRTQLFKKPRTGDLFSDWPILSKTDGPALVMIFVISVVDSIFHN